MVGWCGKLVPGEADQKKKAAEESERGSTRQGRSVENEHSWGERLEEVRKVPDPRLMVMLQVKATLLSEGVKGSTTLSLADLLRKVLFEDLQVKP